MTTLLGGICTAKTVAAAVTVAQVEAVDTVLASLDIPGDATIVDVILTSTDIDTNGTPTIALDVGDAAGPTVPDDDRFIAASDVGEAGTTIRYGATATNPVYTYSTTGEQTIEVTVNTVAATGAAGTVTLTVLYYRG